MRRSLHITVVLLLTYIFPVHADPSPAWRVYFFDDFQAFDHSNWQDQMLWANNKASVTFPKEFLAPAKSAMEHSSCRLLASVGKHPVSTGTRRASNTRQPAGLRVGLPRKIVSNSSRVAGPPPARDQKRAGRHVSRVVAVGRLQQRASHRVARRDRLLAPGRLWGTRHLRAPCRWRCRPLRRAHHRQRRGM